MELSETLFIKGFNNGYFLAKHEPALLESILRQLSPKGNYLEGIFSGKEEYEIDLNRGQLNELQQLRKGGKEQEHDLEME